MRTYAHVTDLSTEALSDAIDARYGPRLRVIPGANDMPDDIASEGARWGKRSGTISENSDPITDSECRERESNPHEVVLGGF
jgi:hypothetical protein